MRTLLVYERSLPGKSPSVSSQLTGSTHNPVARDHDGDGIGSAGTSDRSSGLGLSDRRGHLTIRLHRSVRNGLQIIPDSHLKGRRANVQWKIQGRLSAGD